MAAPKGNTYHLFRKKIGRKRDFTPEELFDGAEEYFTQCDENPFKKVEAKVITVPGKGSKVVNHEVPVPRPYTWEGLCLHLGVSRSYFSDLKLAVAEKNNEKSKVYSEVHAHIEQKIYNQQFSGAAAGFLKENIISRALGLADKKDIQSDGKPITAINYIVPIPPKDED